VFSYPIVPGFDVSENFTARLFFAGKNTFGINQLALKVEKKLSATALSQQFPLRLILHISPLFAAPPGKDQKTIFKGYLGTECHSLSSSIERFGSYFYQN